jgi:hypothetical protein
MKAVKWLKNSATKSERRKLKKLKVVFPMTEFCHIMKMEQVEK